MGLCSILVILGYRALAHLLALVYRGSILELLHRTPVIGVPYLQAGGVPAFGGSADLGRLPQTSRWLNTGWLENPVYLPVAESYTSGIPARGLSRMTLYGYGRVSVREPEGKNLDLQGER